AGNAGGTCETDADCDTAPGNGMCSPGTCVSDMNGVCTSSPGTCTQRTEACDADGSNCNPNTFPADPDCICNTQCAPCAPLTIGDFIFDDVNHNGIQDMGEGGINGVNLNV